jgi:hypothetical protein
MCALAAGLNWVTLNRGYLYAAGILVNVARFDLAHQVSGVTSTQASAPLSSRTS